MQQEQPLYTHGAEKNKPAIAGIVMSSIPISLGIVFLLFEMI